MCGQRTSVGSKMLGVPQALPNARGGKYVSCFLKLLYVVFFSLVFWTKRPAYSIITYVMFT